MKTRFVVNINIYICYKNVRMVRLKLYSYKIIFLYLSKNHFFSIDHNQEPFLGNTFENYHLANHIYCFKCSNLVVIAIEFHIITYLRETPHVTKNELLQACQFSRGTLNEFKTAMRKTPIKNIFKITLI